MTLKIRTSREMWEFEKAIYNNTIHLLKWFFLKCLLEEGIRYKWYVGQLQIWYDDLLDTVLHRSNVDLLSEKLTKKKLKVKDFTLKAVL